MPDPTVEQLPIDGGLTVAAVRGHHPRRPPGPLDDPVDGRRELRRVGRITQLDVVVQHDPVVVVHELRLVTELHRLTQPALGDRPGLRVVQADHPGRTVRHDPADPLPGLLDDPFGGLDQPFQVVDRPDQPSPAPTGGRVNHPGRGQLGRLGAGPVHRAAGVDQHLPRVRDRRLGPGRPAPR